MSEAFTTKQVAEHNTVEKGLYIIVDNDVYKLDSFVDEHPGGAKILKRVGGRDASKQFWKVCSTFAIPTFGAWLAALLMAYLGLLIYSYNSRTAGKAHKQTPSSRKITNG